MCSIYENIDDRAFVGRKQYYVRMFKVNFLGLGLLLLLLLFFDLFIYMHIQLKTQCIFNPCNEFSANDSQTSWS